MKQFQGLVFKAHRSLHHSTPGLKVIKKKKRRRFGYQPADLGRRRPPPPRRAKKTNSKTTFGTYTPAKALAGKSNLLCCFLESGLGVQVKVVDFLTWCFLFARMRFRFSRNAEQFREGLVFKAHRLLYLGSRVIKKKEKLTPASLHTVY